MTLTVRPAVREELERVNELRRQVNDLHVTGRPDIFRPGFVPEMRERIYEIFDADQSAVPVAAADGVICGFAIANIVRKPLSPYNNERSFYHVEEFGVDEAYRRRGVATALIDYMRDDARRRGLDRIELDVWAFNAAALAFYEAAGFRTYRRYMEMDV